MSIPNPLNSEGQSMAKKRKPTSCGTCGREGHSARNKDCPLFNQRVVSTASLSTSIETRTASNISSISQEGNEDDIIEDVENADIIDEDLVLDIVDAPDERPEDDYIVPNWVEINFNEPSVIPNFKATPGPIISLIERHECVTCFDAFACYFDDEIMRNFVNSTNSFGLRKMNKKWYPLTIDEFKTFLSIILTLGFIKYPSRDTVWGDSPMSSSFIRSLMTKARFNLILRAWHYEDENRYPPEELRQRKATTPFWHVREFVSSMALSFQRWYQCGQRVDIDEQCIPWKGRHKSRCYNPNKPEKFHFKCYALNDAETGYMHNVYLYEGAAENRPDDIAATLYPIKKLFQPREIYADKCHIVATDN
eukprot:gene36535-47597_t